MAPKKLADCYVYVLFRADGSPFYVGKGQGDRWLDHERDARRGVRSYRFNIIRQMLADGMPEVPKVKIAEGLTHQRANAYEIALIAAIGRYPNGPLVNLTAGGEGHSDQSPEAREKTREQNRKRVWSAESRAKVAASLRGNKLSPATIAKRSATLRSNAKPRSIETRAKLRAIHLGKPKSAEQVAKMAASKRGKPLPLLSAEHKAAIGNAHRGKIVSTETRAKQSAARYAFYAAKRAALVPRIAIGSP
jgi:hypothetical protein